MLVLSETEINSREWKLIPSIPETDVATVTSNEIKEYHFHIYFHQTNATEHHFALELRDAVLRFCRDGAFVAVPLFRVNTEANGPHPVGSYEIWVPVESFASIFSFIVKNHGKLSVLIHPLTIDEREDHEHRTAWIGQPFPLDLSWVVERLDSVPLQYPTLRIFIDCPPDYIGAAAQRWREDCESLKTGQVGCEAAGQLVPRKIMTSGAEVDYG